MNRAQDGGLRFFSELSEHQISADEFFNVVLLDSLARNFGLKNVLISYFDPQGRFLSWTHRNGVLANHEGHPYRSCLPEDVVRQTLYREAVQDNLTYYNVTPRLYHSTRLIPPQDSRPKPLCAVHSGTVRSVLQRDHGLWYQCLHSGGVF